MRWCFVYQNYITGGLETYVLRMCKYLNLKKNKVFIMCHTISNEMAVQYKEVGAEILIYDDWNRKKIAKELDSRVDVYISFWLSDYYLLKKYSRHAISIMYCVHPSHLTMDNRKKTPIEILKEIHFYKIIKEGINDKTLIVMDQNVVDEVLKKYKLQIKDSEILLLPYDRPKFQKNWKNQKYGYKILTICRADFPFKSYVLGLITSVIQLREKGINCTLTIVSYGKDINVVKNKISNHEYITLLGETKYDDLKQLYLESDIYVGMGSTVVEAASYGIPTILANVNSPNFKSCGLFCDNPQSIGIMKNEGKQGYDLLYDLVSHSPTELNLIGKKCKEAFDKYYCIDEYVEKFLRHIS